MANEKNYRGFLLTLYSRVAFAQKRGLSLKSQSALIMDAQQEHILFHKNPDKVMPIASITKLMTAIVVLDAQLPLDEEIFIEAADVDIIKNTRSRLRVGGSLTRRGNVAAGVDVIGKSCRRHAGT